MRTIFALAVSAAILGAASVAAARVTGIQILSQEPFADGAAFGPAGSYVRVTAIVRGELDPEAPANAGIADLDRAPRNARGMVEYDTDVFLLRPADPAKGSGTMLYEVTNRGNKLLMPWINDAAERPTGSLNDPRTLADAGNTFTFRRGYTMVWSGWQPDAPTTNAGMTIRAPVATDQGRPIVQRIRDEIVAGTRGPERVEIARLPYPAASTDKTRARLTARARQVDPRTEIPPDDWAFVDSHSVRLLPQGTLFKPRQIYELWYEATDPTVTGIGFAATRDLVSFLRYERTDAQGNANPLLAGGNGIRHTIGFGISLSGRFIRNYLELGMNADEAGRRVFDGVLPHISGAGKVFGNTAFAMPGRTATQHEDRFYPENWFPYGYATLPDPVSGKPGSLLRGDGSDPLIVETNTSTEYWQKGASLVHTDPATGADVALPPNVRMFLIAGTEHAGHAGTPSAPGFCANARNPTARDRRSGRCWPTLINGWRTARRPRPAACPAPATAPASPPRQSAFPPCPASSGRPATTRSGRRWTGSTHPRRSAARTGRWSPPLMPTATRWPACTCRISRRRRPRSPAPTCIATTPRNCATATEPPCRSPAPRRSARARETRAAPLRNATGRETGTRRRSKAPPIPWWPPGFCCRRTPPATSTPLPPAS